MWSRTPALSNISIPCPGDARNGETTLNKTGTSILIRTRSAVSGTYSILLCAFSQNTQSNLKMIMKCEYYSNLL